MRWLVRRSSPVWLFALTACASACTQDDAAASPAYGASHDAGSEAAAPDGSADAPVDAAPNLDSASDAPVDSTVEAAAPQGPALYPSDRTHSPVTPWVVERMAEILERDGSSRRDLFMKVGDSITASGAFLTCFAGSNVDLDSHASLQPTIDLYRNATVEGTTPFDRTSYAVEIGRTAWWAMSGQPSPLQQELASTHAAVAVVMYGTNDIGWFGDDHVATLKWYHDNMFDLVDMLLDEGVVPILSTIPPRDDDSSLDAWVPTFNAVIRGMAQGRQVPLVDFHRELLPLAGHGLGGDGVHPNSYSAGACVLDADGLAKGYNLRNLITLEALDRVRRAALAGEGAIDDTAPMLEGQGTVAEPFVIQGNPFTDVRSTVGAVSHELDTYTGCGSTADESGPEHLYRLVVDKNTRVRAIVLDRGNVDVDVHLLDGTASEAGCLARGDTIVQADLVPGTYHFAVDTYVDNGVQLSGDYLFVVLTCDPGDPACE